ncbi:hypothetical protein C8R47DRAFT_1157387 [Mycena vitilis]|nr:hypothetical protein C8R47DRAFT_1157387 [Mycena vitilis]
MPRCASGVHSLSPSLSPFPDTTPFLLPLARCHLPIPCLSIIHSLTSLHSVVGSRACSHSHSRPRLYRSRAAAQGQPQPQPPRAPLPADEPRRARVGYSHASGRPQRACHDLLLVVDTFYTSESRVDSRYGCTSCGDETLEAERGQRRPTGEARTLGVGGAREHGLHTRAVITIPESGACAGIRAPCAAPTADIQYGAAAASTRSASPTPTLAAIDTSPAACDPARAPAQTLVPASVIQLEFARCCCGCVQPAVRAASKYTTAAYAKQEWPEPAGGERGASAGDEYGWRRTISASDRGAENWAVVVQRVRVPVGLPSSPVRGRWRVGSRDVWRYTVRGVVSSSRTRTASASSSAADVHFHLHAVEPVVRPAYAPYAAAGVAGAVWRRRRAGGRWGRRCDG